MESKLANNTYNCRSFCWELWLNSPGIQQRLQIQMQAAIDLYIKMQGIMPAEVSLDSSLISYAVRNKADNNYQLLYRSPIALKLSNIWKINPLNLATNLALCLQETSADNANRVKQYGGNLIEFTLEVLATGGINFYLNKPGIAVWLQQLIQIRNLDISVATVDRTSQSKSYQNLFPLQYIHARCCSLLRLAHREGLITLDPDTSDLVGQIIQPNPLPWDKDGSFLEHLDEQHLILQMVSVIDELSSFAQPSAMKLADRMEKFYRNCRIFGEVKLENPQLAQTRLGLVAVARLLLRSLLENYYGVFAPEEL